MSILSHYGSQTSRGDHRRSDGLSGLLNLSLRVRADRISGWLGSAVGSDLGRAGAVDDLPSSIVCISGAPGPGPRRPPAPAQPDR